MKTIILYIFIRQQHFFFASLLSFILFTEILQSQITPEVLWAKRYGGANADVPVGVVTDAFGNVYMSGTFSSPIAFGSTILSTDLRPFQNYKFTKNQTF